MNKRLGLNASFGGVLFLATMACASVAVAHVPATAMHATPGDEQLAETPQPEFGVALYTMPAASGFALADIVNEVPLHNVAAAVPTAPPNALASAALAAPESLTAKAPPGAVAVAGLMPNPNRPPATVVYIVCQSPLTTGHVIAAPARHLKPDKQLIS